MTRYGIGVVFLTYTFITLTNARYNGEDRMHNEATYFEYQDIVKEYNQSHQRWVYGLNYVPQYHVIKESCLYFTTDKIMGDKVNFTMHFMNNSQNGTEQKYGTFYKTSNFSTNGTKRNEYNAIQVSKTPGEDGDKRYQQLYSDYEKCAFYLALHEIPHRTTTLPCLVFITPAANGTMPDKCKKVYNNMCGEEHTLYVAFNKTCKDYKPPALTDEIKA